MSRNDRAIGSLRRTLIAALQDKEFRDAYVDEHIKVGVAYQIRAMRTERGWSQAQLAGRMNRPQTAISRLEDPGYGRVSVSTLLALASAFDVALLVRFVGYSELLRRTADLSPKALSAPDFLSESISYSDLGTAQITVSNTAAEARTSDADLAGASPLPRRPRERPTTPVGGGTHSLIAVPGVKTANE